MKQVYLKLFIKEVENLTLTYVDRKLRGFNAKSVYYLAKSSGLKSKAKRKLLKRFRKQFNILLKKGMELAEEESNQGA